MTKAFDCALRLLTRREHSLLELKNKLKQKGYFGTELNDAVVECQRLAYQSDERFTEQLCRARMNQGYGPLRIQQELSAKGIDETLIEQILGQETETSWLERAQAVSRKKVVSQASLSWEDQQKLKRFLLYRGFPASIIVRVFALK